MDDWYLQLRQLSASEQHLLRRIAESLPLLSDLARADLLVYGPTDIPDTAIVIAEIKPHTVPSLFNDSLVGRLVTKADEWAVIRALTRGTSSESVTRLRSYGVQTVQHAYPIHSEGRVIAALSAEVGLLESGRQRRKSIVFRRAVAQLRDMVLRGQLEGAAGISALGDHDGPMVIDNRGNILYISSIAEHHYRKLGHSHTLLRTNLNSLQTDEAAFFKAIETGACVEQITQEHAQERTLTFVKRAVPLIAEPSDQWWKRYIARPDEIDGSILITCDVTDERRKEQELKIKSAMIQEIHHRVKNNLQTIAALLRLQARRTGSPEITEVLQETINRILSIAVVHEFLAHDESSIVNVKEVCQRIITEVARSTLDPEKRLRFSLSGEDLYLPTQQATSCALIVNELLQNAVEHGFDQRSEGTISISLNEEGSNSRIEVQDDGHGLPAEAAGRIESSLGLQIVRTLVREDLKGWFELRNGDGRGARAIVTFPRVARTAALLGA
ncbi:MAG: sensor histidine kinase [Chloroflexi bacterium]|nr:sensor histidine kinase [Chloroflexota bacterium]